MRYSNFSPPVYFFTASGSSSSPRPGLVGIANMPSVSSFQPPTVISSMKEPPSHPELLDWLAVTPW